MNGPPPNGSQSVQGTANRVCANQSNLDAQIICLSKPWSGSLPAHVRVIDDNSVIHKEDDSNVKLQAVDIVNYLNGQKYPCHEFYFSRDKHPPPLGCPSSSDVSDVSSWIALKKALLQDAHDADNTLVGHGKG